MSLKSFALTLLVVGTVGCAANHGRYAMLSNRPVKLRSVTADALASGTPSWGESTCKSIFIVPVERGCSMNKAMVEALKNGDLLVDATVTYQKVDLFPFFERETWRVSGKTVNLQP